MQGSLCREIKQIQESEWGLLLLIQGCFRLGVEAGNELCCLPVSLCSLGHSETGDRFHLPRIRRWEKPGLSPCLPFVLLASRAFWHHPSCKASAPLCQRHVVKKTMSHDGTKGQRRGQWSRRDSCTHAGIQHASMNGCG